MVSSTDTKRRSPLLRKKIVPGRIATEGRTSIPEDIPMQRRGTTDEIALTTLFLASDDSAYVTGERIMATGGRTNL